MHTRAHKVTWYGKSGDQLKKKPSEMKRTLQKFDDFH